jgi:hypothetical protein
MLCFSTQKKDCGHTHTERNNWLVQCELKVISMTSHYGLFVVVVDNGSTGREAGRLRFRNMQRRLGKTNGQFNKAFWHN